MNCLWSDKPVNVLAKSVESMTSLQRHVTLEAVIGLMRNTGAAINKLFIGQTTGGQFISPIRFVWAPASSTFRDSHQGVSKP
eukprot:1189297-Prorocentrum_minimum.AAC.3